MIQVQKNAFLLNWRRRESGDPHFAEQLKPEFDNYFGIFETLVQEVVGEKSLRLGVCELAHVTVIQPRDDWQGPQDTPNIIPCFSYPDRGPGDGNASAFNNVFCYELGPRLQLRVAIRTAQARNDPISPRLILEFKALGHLGGVAKSDTETWHSAAHDAIVAWFLNMTSKDVQCKYWIQEGDGN